MVENPTRAFALQTRGEYLGCFFRTYTTEHPKLVIVPSSGEKFYFSKQKTTTSSLDLMAYMNSKFVYVEIKHEKEISTLYQELSTQRCMLEHRTLTNLLALAVIKPIEFAYVYMSSPGYTAMIAGEVIHLAQCQAVDVKLRPSTHCYHELPVSYMNQTLFMTPRSHLLQEYGTELDCSELISPQYYIVGEWYSMLPHRHVVRSPQILSLHPITEWKGQNIDYLAMESIHLKTLNSFVKE